MGDPSKRKTVQCPVEVYYALSRIFLTVSNATDEDYDVVRGWLREKSAADVRRMEYSARLAAWHRQQTEK